MYYIVFELKWSFDLLHLYCKCIITGTTLEKLRKQWLKSLLLDFEYILNIYYAGES